jgi:UDP-2-acetamido-2,6-beta-L-arabino-hexul-4-ose reductase
MSSVKTHVWQEPFDILSLEKRSDSRGYLFEILRFQDHQIPGGGQLYTFSIEPGKRRGDHYHLKKKEWFTCVHGRAGIILTAQNGESKEFDLTSDDPKIVYAGPGTTHALINRTPDVAVIVSYGSEQHNPVDEDTYRKIAGDDRGK